MSLDAALVALYEAQAKHRAIRDRQPIEAVMTAAVGKVLRAQGRAWRAQLGALREAASDDDRMISAWQVVARKTRKQLAAPLVAGMDAAHTAGQKAVAKDDLAGYGGKPPRGGLLPADPTPVGPSVGLTWTARDPRVASYLEDNVGELIADINDATRRRIGELIKQGVAAGSSPAVIAGQITDEFEAMGDPRPQAHTTTRAMVIAATEVSNGYAQGKLDGARAIAGPLGIEKSWLTVGAGNCCDDCTDNQAAGWIDDEEDFPSGDQCPTAHPSCRCTLMIRSARGGAASSTQDDEEEG